MVGGRVGGGERALTDDEWLAHLKGDEPNGPSRQSTVDSSSWPAAVVGAGSTESRAPGSAGRARSAATTDC